MSKPAPDKDARRADAILKACWSLDDWRDTWSEAGLHLKGFSVRAPPATGAEWLLTARAITSEGDVVAFISGEDVGYCLTKLVGGIESGTLKWKVDAFGR